MMKHLSPKFFALALACASLCPTPAGAQDQAATLKQPWPARIVELAESLPVQDGGRIKPFHTYASFTLLGINGKRTLETPSGERISAVEWLLDTLFFPEAASDYETFLIQDSEAAHAIGISTTDKKKRDRYSFNELMPGIPRLFQLAHEYDGIERKDRSTVQEQIHLLAGNVNRFMQLRDHMAFAREPMTIAPGGALSEVFDGRTEIYFRDVLAELPSLGLLYGQLSMDPASPESEAGMQELDLVLTQASHLADSTHSLALLPPAGSVAEQPEWATPADILNESIRNPPIAAGHLAMLGDFSVMARNPGDFAGFERSLEDLHTQSVQLATARGEYGKVGLELTYYKAKLLTWSLYAFVLGFLVMAFMWLRPHSKLLYRSTQAIVFTGTLLLIGAIVMRCMIRGRPPVSTLYETVLFVTAVGALVALVTEAINRQRIAISAAAGLGMVGLFLANGYEMLDKQDTMPSLVAVLDTNFWLATHVTAITIGYSAGMLAAVLASIYLVAKTLRVKREDRAFYKGMARMVYGVLCFGMIFATVGTILGGIWANDSWGRFWGWDPKENGALLIVLSQIAILHGRMGGYLRDLGMCMAVAFAGTVVAFSWWGVNLLGVGLHSYGFTSGISKALWTYYTIQWGIVGLGALVWLRERGAARVPVTSSKAAPKGRKQRDADDLAPGVAAVSNPPS